MLIDFVKIRRFFLIFAVLIAVFSFISQSSFAQEEEDADAVTEVESYEDEEEDDSEDKSDMDPYVGDDLSVAKCIAKGDIDFGLFLDSIIYNDGFYEGVIEPWVDVLMRNKCHVTDVSGLIRQQDKIREYIRDAFLTCNNQKISSLEVAYNKLSMEIYYVRHVVDGSIVLSLPYEFLTTRMLEDEESLYYPREKLYSEMVDKYVSKGIISQSDFDLFFSKLEFKYEDRKKTYVICEEDSWDQVAEKWEDFVNSGAGTIPALKSFKKTVGGRAEKIVEAVTDMGLKAYLSGIIQINLNNMDMEAGFTEIADNISDYIPNVEFPTQSTMLDAIEIADKKYNTAEMREKISSNFEVLYRDTSDSATMLLVQELDAFNQAILDSFTPLDTILECTEVMNDRQCPSNF
jgi:hypothetical protein